MSDQLNAAADAIEEAIAWSLVGIVCGSGADRWRGIGTGTLARWKDRHLVLTAEHVIGDTSPEDLRFFLRNDAPIVRTDREALLALPGVPSSTLQPFQELELERIVSDGELDLAALLIDASIEERHPVRFFQLDEGATTPPEGQTTVAVGFPHDISRVTRQEERVIFTHVEWTQIAAPREHLEDFDTTKHFLAGFTLTQTYPDADPHGLSGSAMWWQRPTPGVWHPSLDIAGMTIAYYRRPSLLKMVRREVLEGFLSDRL